MRVEPRAGGGHEIRGDKPFRAAEARDDRLRPLGDRRIGRREVAAARGVGGVVHRRRRPRPEVPRPGEASADEPRADDRTVRVRIRLPACLSGTATRANAHTAAG